MKRPFGPGNPGKPFKPGADARRGKGRLKKGESANRTGRPKGSIGLAAYIKSKTRDCFDIADFYLAILMGNSDILNKKYDFQRPPSLENKMDAAEWLSDRGVGKAPVTLANDTGEKYVVLLPVQDQGEAGKVS